MPTQLAVPLLETLQRDLEAVRLCICARVCVCACLDFCSLCVCVCGSSLFSSLISSLIAQHLGRQPQYYLMACKAYIKQEDSEDEEDEPAAKRGRAAKRVKVCARACVFVCLFVCVCVCVCMCACVCVCGSLLGLTYSQPAPSEQMSYANDEDEMLVAVRFGVSCPLPTHLY
jgi:hypothetical protein